MRKKKIPKKTKAASRRTHLFVECEKAKATWKKASKDQYMSLSSMGRFLCPVNCGSLANERLQFRAAFVHFIWHLAHRRRYTRTPLGPLTLAEVHQVVDSIVDASQLYCSTRSKYSIVMASQLAVRQQLGRSAPRELHPTASEQQAASERAAQKHLSTERQGPRTTSILAALRVYASTRRSSERFRVDCEAVEPPKA